MRMTEEERRNRLRDIGEWFIELSEDDYRHVRFVFEEIHACTCSKCGDYADDIVESIKVVYTNK